MANKFARTLRSNLTDAERILWSRLRDLKQICHPRPRVANESERVEGRHSASVLADPGVNTRAVVQISRRSYSVFESVLL